MLLACAGGLQLHGVVAISTVYQDSTWVRVVGGRGTPGAMVATAYAGALLRDPLGAIADAGGESIDATSTASVLGLSLSRWDIAGAMGPALDALADEAQRQAGGVVSWRFLPSGALWFGAETWPTLALPAGDVVQDPAQLLRLFPLAVETPTIVPGVELEDIGRVRYVSHQIGGEGVRSLVTLWT